MLGAYAILQFYLNFRSIDRLWTSMAHSSEPCTYDLGVGNEEGG